MCRIVWLPVNQAWAVMFGSSVLRLFVDKQEAEDYLDYIEGAASTRGGE